MKKLLYTLLILLTLFGQAQQTSIFGQYTVNPFLFNPSAAGQGEYTQAFLHYRNQWVGITGSPETFAFTIDGKLKNQPIGIGLKISNDINNIIGQTQFGLSGSYTAQLAEDQSFSFGMSTQVIQNRIYFERVEAEDISDPDLLNSIDQRTTFEMGTGLTYRWKALQVGVAADQLLQNGVTFENNAQSRNLDFNYVRHYIGSMQYRFVLNPNFDLEPMIFARVVQGLPSQFDFNLTGTYKKKVWATTTYRHEVGMAFSMGFDIQNQMTIGYAYEIPITDLNLLSSYTHEFVIGWRFNRSGGAQSSGGGGATGNKRKLERENALQYQEIDELRQRNERVNRELEETNRKFDQQQEEIDLLKEQLDAYRQEIGNVQYQSAVAIEEMEDSKEDSKGDFYVIIGAFKTLKSSKTFQQIIKRKQGPATKIIQNDRGSFYLIYTDQFERLNDAKEQLDTVIGEHIADEITGNPWIYVKQPSEDD